MFKASSLQLHDARSLRHKGALYINIRTQPTSAVILFVAKSAKIFHDAIMLVMLIKIDFHLRLAESIGEIHSQRADSFVKHRKLAPPYVRGKLVPDRSIAQFQYILTRETGFKH